MKPRRRETCIACHASARVSLFFPPDNMAIIARYRQSDSAGFDAFKQTARDAVARYNAQCANKVVLFDFMEPNGKLYVRDNEKLVCYDLHR